MKITTLLENTTVDPSLTVKHGLSILIETENASILFDTGPDDSFIGNAEKLGVDLSAVDYLIVSHGHSDHGGGLNDFPRVNSKAKVYLTQLSLDPHCAKTPDGKTKDLSVTPDARIRDRLRPIQSDSEISPQLRLFTHFPKPGFIPSQNANLYKKSFSDELISDDFDHETCLLIQSEGKNIIITGCSHSGAGNMIQSVMTKSGISAPDLVIGGFHLTNPDAKTIESEDKMNQLAEELNQYPDTRYYTGHCTGADAYRYLKTKMGDRLEEIKTGLQITV